MSSLQFVSLSSEGEVRPEVFEIQLSAFSDHDQRSKNFFRKKAWESYLTLIDRITCVSTEGRGQAVDRRWTTRGQGVDKPTEIEERKWKRRASPPLNSARRVRRSLYLHYFCVLAAFNPFNDLGNAPDRERMREARVDDVCPELVELFRVVVLLEFASLFEE